MLKSAPIAMQSAASRQDRHLAERASINACVTAWVQFHRPPLIDCLFPARRPRLLLPATSLPFSSQVRHMHMRKSIKRYETVLELTNPHHDVELFRMIFATVDLYYPTRPLDAIFVPTAGRTARGIIIITARPHVFNHVYGTGNNQSNTQGLTKITRIRAHPVRTTRPFPPL